MAINYPDDGLPASEGGDDYAELPIRTGGAGYSVRNEARAELRDRETYYAELRYAVYCQSRSVPVSPGSARVRQPDIPTRRPTPGTWEEMVARFSDDTWT